MFFVFTRSPVYRQKKKHCGGCKCCAGAPFGIGTGDYYVPEGIQGSRRVVSDPRHTRCGGSVPQGAGKKRTRPVAAVTGGWRHREHDDLRPTDHRSACRRICRNKL